MFTRVVGAWWRDTGSASLINGAVEHSRHELTMEYPSEETYGRVSNPQRFADDRQHAFAR